MKIYSPKSMHPNSVKPNTFVEANKEEPQISREEVIEEIRNRNYFSPGSGIVKESYLSKTKKRWFEKLKNFFEYDHVY
jgi:hypothetical protein